MEREQVLKVMVPAAAFALLLLIIGVVIALAGGGAPCGTVPEFGKKGPDEEGGKELGSAPDDGAGMTPDLPPTVGPEWKEVAGKPGLRFWDVKEGTEDVVAGTTDAVKVRYTGWVATSGSRFDGGPDKPPISFALKKVIAGWTFGIPGMKVGGVRRLYIPAHLAYADNPPPNSNIPSNADLVFEVKLIRVVRQ